MKEVIDKMKETYQIPEKQTVYQHGVSVWSYFKDLILNDASFYDWKLPDWFVDNKDFINDNLLDMEEIKRYTIFHDCGKPYCIEYDEYG